MSSLIMLIPADEQCKGTNNNDDNDAYDDLPDHCYRPEDSTWSSMSTVITAGPPGVIVIWHFILMSYSQLLDPYQS